MIVQFASFLLLSKAGYSGLIHISQNHDKKYIVKNYLQYTKYITVDKLLTYFVIGQIVGVVIINSIDLYFKKEKEKRKKKSDRIIFKNVNFFYLI